MAGSAADYVSLRRGDCWWAAGGRSFESAEDLREALDRSTGQSVTLQFLRGGQAKKREVTIRLTHGRRLERSEEDLRGAAEEKIRVLVIGESPIVRAVSKPPSLSRNTSKWSGRAMLLDPPPCLKPRTRRRYSWNAARSIRGCRASRRRIGSRSKAACAALTPREIEVLRLLADGASNKMIAHKLGISDHTVKFHVTSILTKLNAGSRTEAVTLGVRMGLVYL